MVDHHQSGLIDERHKLVMLWSEKASCTTAIVMMLRHMGLLEEAKAYHYWIHKYRSEVFYKKYGFVDLNKHLLSGKYFVFKVIRNPYDRAVSSYLHTMKYCLVDEPQYRMSFEQYLMNL